MHMLKAFCMAALRLVVGSLLPSSHTGWLMIFAADRAVPESAWVPPLYCKYWSSPSACDWAGDVLLVLNSDPNAMQWIVTGFRSVAKPGDVAFVVWVVIRAAM